MEDVYKKVKSQGRFMKLLEDVLNTNNMQTAQTTGNPAGVVGVNPQIDPKLKKAQEDARKAGLAAAKAELSALQSTTNMNQQRARDLQDMIAGRKPIQPKV